MKNKSTDNFFFSLLYEHISVCSHNGNSKSQHHIHHTPHTHTHQTPLLHIIFQHSVCVIIGKQQLPEHQPIFLQYFHFTPQLCMPAAYALVQPYSIYSVLLLFTHQTMLLLTRFKKKWVQHTQNRTSTRVSFPLSFEKYR